MNNLHGMPSLMAGIAGILIIFVGKRSCYLNHLNLSGRKQCSTIIQAAALRLTLCVALVGGLFTGLILRLSPFVHQYENFDDEPNWHLPSTDTETINCNRNLDRRFSITPVANMNANSQ